MSWANLATNQTISFDNLKNAVANSVFTPKTTIPVGSEQIIKTEADTYVNIDTAWPSYVAKANNQLVVKQDLQPPPGVTQTQTPSNSPTPSTTTTLTATPTQTPTNTPTTTTTLTATPTPTQTQTPRPSCPDRRVVIQVCNSNAQRDDNFDVYLNGTYIGALNLNQNAQVGSIFLGDSNTNVTVTEPDFTCPLANMVTYRFANNTVIRGGNNVLFMDNTQNNGNGNLGTVEIRNYLLVGNDLEQPCGIANLTFNGASGSDFTFNFQYDECCAFTITPTPTNTPTNTRTPTQTPSNSPAAETQLYIYAKYISGVPSGSDELQYQINGGTVFSFGAPISTSTCDFFTLLGGLTAGDTVTFSTASFSVLGGDGSDCPSTANSCSVTTTIGSGSNFFYITTNPLITC